MLQGPSEQGEIVSEQVNPMKKRAGCETEIWWFSYETEGLFLFLKSFLKDFFTA